MVEKVDYCGIVSGKETDKSHLFRIFYGELKTAPMISECPVTAECKVIQIIDLPSTLLILGEMVAAYSESRYLTENRLDISKVDPIALSVPDNRYWGGVGRYLGDAWSIGNKVKRS
jgi:flavin reductase (DIM6/NTAB) family NADH-FMN oxidoreductase RutF